MQYNIKGLSAKCLLCATAVFVRKENADSVACRQRHKKKERKYTNKMATNMDGVKVCVGLLSVAICQTFQCLMHFLFYGQIIKYSLVLLLLGKAQRTKQMLNYTFKIFK